MTPVVEPGLYVFKGNCGFMSWSFWGTLDNTTDDSEYACPESVCTVLEQCGECGWGLKCLFRERMMFTGPVHNFVDVWKRVA